MQVDLFRVPLKDSSDPRWLGAWWIGFLVSAIFGILTAFPILSFARELPEAKRHRAKDVNQVWKFIVSSVRFSVTKNLVFFFIMDFYNFVWEKKGSR